VPNRRRFPLLILLAAGLTVLLVAPASAARPGPSGPRTVSFGGITWLVKDFSRKIGPGPNYFGATTSNVWTDSAGLHLKITKSGAKWYCAEVIGQTSLAYGTYAWTITGHPALDPNVTLGLFTWNDDAAYAHRELDFEEARWGNAADPTNTQYVVQPYDATGHLVRETLPTTQTLVHSFRWAPGRVDFETRTTAGALVRAWSYIGSDVPVPGGENPRMNLWLFRGSAPANGQPVEIVVNAFSWTPLP